MRLANWLAMAAVALAFLGNRGGPFPGYSVAERQIVSTQCRQSFRERDAFTGCFVGLVADRP